MITNIKKMQQMNKYMNKLLLLMFLFIVFFLGLVSITYICIYNSNIFSFIIGLTLSFILSCINIFIILKIVYFFLIQSSFQIFYILLAFLSFLFLIIFIVFSVLNYQKLIVGIICGFIAPIVLIFIDYLFCCDE